jgi:hypothetical protein
MLHPQAIPSGAMGPASGRPLDGVVPRDPKILVPEHVGTPLPKQTIEEVTVPASINGRDLSRGQP